MLDGSPESRPSKNHHKCRNDFLALEQFHRHDVEPAPADLTYNLIFVSFWRLDLSQYKYVSKNIHVPKNKHVPRLCLLKSCLLKNIHVPRLCLLKSCLLKNIHIPKIKN